MFDEPTLDTVFHHRHTLGKLEVIATTPTEAAKTLCELSISGIPAHVHLVNAYTIALAAKSDAYLTCLKGSALNLPDGKPLSWFSRLFRQQPAIQQVRGPQLFLDSFEASQHLDVKHFLLGSTDTVLARLSMNLMTKFPSATIVGSESPPFRELTAGEYAAQDARILSSGADIVWVGLGTPKQDFEARRLAEATGLVAVAVGAAFDFTAGTLREAPDWMKKLGCEWLFRLVSEPRRLWKRYLIGNLTFIKAVFEGQSRWR